MIIWYNMGKRSKEIQGHDVWLVDSKTDHPVTFVIDLSGAQYGIREPAWVFEDWESLWNPKPKALSLVALQDIVPDFEKASKEASIFCQNGTANSEANVRIAAEIENVAIKWERQKLHGLPKLSEILDKPKSEYERLCKAFVEDIGKAAAAECKKQGRKQRKESLSKVADWREDPTLSGDFAGLLRQMQVGGFAGPVYIVS